MNQAERELFFKEEELNYPLKDKPAYSFPQGNHKRSLVGRSWYYLAESDTDYNLLKDQVEATSTEGVWMSLWADGVKLIDNLTYITWNDYHRIYPVQPLFPYLMDEPSALVLLKSYFRNKERSTTIETLPERKNGVE